MKPRKTISNIGALALTFSVMLGCQDDVDRIYQRHIFNNTGTQYILDRGDKTEMYNFDNRGRFMKGPLRPQTEEYHSPRFNIVNPEGIPDYRKEIMGIPKD